MAKSSFNKLIESEKPVLIDFWAEWCGPCRMVAPIVKQVKKKYDDKIHVVKIDTEKNQKLSGQLGIRSIPTLMIFQNGKVKWRAVGVQSESAISAEIDKLL